MNKFFMKIFLILLVLIAVSFRTTSQDKPTPIKSPTIDMLLGSWESTPYQMMGSTWTDEVTFSMQHNGQYLFIELSGKDDKGNAYTGTIVNIPKSDGSFTGYQFNDWGGVSTIEGKTDGNKIHSITKADWGSEVRDIEINGNTMTHNVSWTIAGKDGNMTQKATYNFRKK